MVFMFFFCSLVKCFWQQLTPFGKTFNISFRFFVFVLFFYASMRTLPITSATTLRLAWQIYHVRLSEGVCAYCAQ